MKSGAPRWLRLAALAFFYFFWIGEAQAIRPARSYPQDKVRFGLDRPERRRQKRQPSTRARGAAAALKTSQGGNWKVSFDPRTGAVSSLSMGATAPRQGKPEDIAAAYLNESRDFIQVDPAALSVSKRSAAGGITHILYQQMYRGIPVEFARVKVHVADSGSILGVNSTFEPDLSLNIIPGLSDRQAFEAVRGEIITAQPAPGALVIFPDEQTATPRLAWKFSVRTDGNLWRYYIDAHAGQVLFRYDDLRHVCVTSGTVLGSVFDLNPSSTPAKIRPFANQRVYVNDGSIANSAVTGSDGSFCATAAGAQGKITTGLQGPYVNVSNFRGPSAHYDNGNGVWSTVATPVSSPHSYPNGTTLLSTIDLTASAPLAVKFLPIFSAFQVGGWSGGDITDDDQLTILNSSGSPVASYIGNRGAFNGAAVAGKSLQLKLHSNAAGQNYGYDVALSSYLTLTAPTAWNLNGSSLTWTTAHTSNGGRSEMSLFYHLNAIHDYFMEDVDRSSAAFIGNPVVAMAYVGPNLNGAFYSPDDDNLFFGDVSDASPSDLISDDATVSHHEYTHYLVEKIWPIQNFGQAGAISEAIADYFSGTSLNDSSIGLYYNGGTALRELDCPGKASCKAFSAATWNGEIHADSIFLSQALWDIRKARIASQGLAMGRSCADGLAFQALLFFPESFTEFYTAISEVDRLGLVPNCNPGLNASNAAQASINTAFTAHMLTGSSGDVYETNDGFQSSVDISTLGPISATIFPAADTDFYSFGAGPGNLLITLTLPADSSPGLYKAYALTLFDRKHIPIATAEPSYNICEQGNCTTNQGEVTISFNSSSPNYYYLRVTGGPITGDLLNGSNSGVNSTTPYSLRVEFPRAGALGASIVNASFDGDRIGFSVAVTTFVRTQDVSFAYAQLRDQSQTLLANTATTGVSPWLAIVSSQNALGAVTGTLQLRPGFANRFPAVGSVYLEVFGYNVTRSTFSLGLSQSLNLTADRSDLTAWNNVFNPRGGEKTTIKYQTTQSGRVTIKLFTMNGSLVQTILDGEYPAGKGSVDWYGKNMNQVNVASGIYLLHISAPGLSKTQKIVVVK